KLFGPDYGKLRELAEIVGKRLEERGKGRGIKEVNSNVFAGNPDLLIKVDGIRAGRVGVAAEEGERQARATYLGQGATRVLESALRITDVRVRYPDAVRFGSGCFAPSLIGEQWLLVPGSGTPTAGLARAVPVSAVAEVRPTRTPDEQSRENQQPAVIVTADLAA